MGATPNGRVPIIILTAPKAVKSLVGRLSQTATPIVERNDPNAGKPRVMYFGTTKLQDNLKGLIKLDERDVARQERSMVDTTAGGKMHYLTGASGSYVVDVNGQGSASTGGSITVTANIRGQSPYGLISGSGRGYYSWSKARNTGDAYMTMSNLDMWYTKALLEATLGAQKSFADAMRSAGPPPISQLREQSWQEIVAYLTGVGMS